MVTASYVNELIAKSHSMAKEKGWWPEEGRDHYEVVNLIHSEVSEALEELRDGHGVTEIYFNTEKPEKPEGFAIELADVAIRAADYAGKGEAICPDEAVVIGERIFAEQTKGFGLQMHIAGLNYGISTLFLYENAYADLCVKIILHCFSIAETQDIDLVAAIERKMAYNATRGFRHGRAF